MARSPDIEIYIKDAVLDHIQNWLSQYFDGLELRPMAHGHGWTGSALHDGMPIPISLFSEAAGKRYSCLVFDSNRTPWGSDLECARSAWQHLHTEIRCSTGGWQEGEDEEGGRWWRLDEQGEGQVNWQ
ncbi:MAG: hypothetical protein LPK85_03590 [Gammaproteobacteria bacterium]|nr:hypothetical protein [Gammaproteobacteria bacterium]